MVLRIRVRPDGSPRASSSSPRRPSIYPHRSVRFVSLTRQRTLLAVAAALILCFVIGFNAFDLFQLHARMAAFFLDAAHIPISGWQYVDIFPGLGPSLAAATNVPLFRELPPGASIAFIIFFIVLLVIAQRVALTRNFALFLAFLLICSAISVVLDPKFRFTSTEFTQIWLRNEVCIWLLLPWVSVTLFITLQPSFAKGLSWMLFLEIYAIASSALRMSFAHAVMYYTGMLFFPILWFAVGLLSNLLYVLLFYSISVHRTSLKIWGSRA
jgi:hypothetical protein